MNETLNISDDESQEKLYDKLPMNSNNRISSKLDQRMLTNDPNPYFQKSFDAEKKKKKKPFHAQTEKKLNIQEDNMVYDGLTTALNVNRGEETSFVNFIFFATKFISKIKIPGKRKKKESECITIDESTDSPPTPKKNNKQLNITTKGNILKPTPKPKSQKGLNDGEDPDFNPNKSPSISQLPKVPRKNNMKPISPPKYNAKMNPQPLNEENVNLICKDSFRVDKNEYFVKKFRFDETKIFFQVKLREEWVIVNIKYNGIKEVMICHSKKTIVINGQPNPTLFETSDHLGYSMFFFTFENDVGAFKEQMEILRRQYSVFEDAKEMRFFFLQF